MFKFKIDFRKNEGCIIESIFVECSMRLTYFAIQDMIYGKYPNSVIEKVSLVEIDADGQKKLLEW